VLGLCRRQKKVLDEIKLLVAFLDLIENFDETTIQLFFQKKIRFQRLTVVRHNLLILRGFHILEKLSLR
jgi:hypothetical protein